MLSSAVTQPAFAWNYSITRTTRGDGRAVSLCILRSACDPGRGRPSGERSSRRRSFRALSFQQFLLVRQRRYRGPLGGFAVGRHEYGLPDGWRSYGIADPIPGEPFWMVGFIPDRCGALRGGCFGLVAGGSGMSGGSGGTSVAVLAIARTRHWYRTESEKWDIGKHSRVKSR